MSDKRDPDERPADGTDNEKQAEPPKRQRARGIGTFAIGTVATGRSAR